MPRVTPPPREGPRRLVGRSARRNASISDTDYTVLLRSDEGDDRLLLNTNLIDTFDLLMGFVEKHLNDPFHLEGTTRISLRDRIFRELVSNLIAHREYISAAPATMTIFRDKVVFRNPHVPHLRGPIDPAHFTPFPKNPTICRFMLQLGRYEEIGSGVYNVNKYLPIYSHGGKPVFEEQADLFVTTIPLTTAPERVTPEVRRMLSGMTGEMTRGEIQTLLGLKDEKHFRENYQQIAVALGLIEMTIPDKPRSRLQKYRLTEKGRNLLARGKDS